MLITSTENVKGREIKKTLGIVMGNTVRAKHLGKDILAGLKTIIGGEITEYTEMLSDARQESINRMIKNGKKIGADAIVSVRFVTAQTMPGAAELLAYGTAVKLK